MIRDTELQITSEPAIAYSTCYRLPFLSLFHADCMEIMKQYPDKHFDLAIVDPPYGLKIANSEYLGNDKNDKRWNGRANGYRHTIKDWDNEIPTAEYFAELERVSKNQIIWGANYFVEHLHKGTKGWVVWYKGQEGLTMSDAELAYSSFDCATRVVKINRVELLKDGTIHPTQKPIKLYKWLLENYTNENDLILDTHLGSGSIAIACHQMKRKLIGYEIDADYYRKACKRFEEQTRQTSLW